MSSEQKTWQSSILNELQWRALIHQTTHDEELDKALYQGSTTLYAGFDPSADSLHVGNLLPLMGLAFFLRHGHNPMALVGGATGLIGDPSGKEEERTLKTKEQVQANLEGIRGQLETILSRVLTMHTEGLAQGVEAKDIEVPLVNNADWFGQWSYLDFLREVGKFFRVNQMIAKDSVRNRLESREQGISYTEFSYMLIQAYDFFHLYKHHGCRLQIGGSDQWGNITEGTELIKRKGEQGGFGLTFPLLTNAEGKKMGKSEKGAVYLSASYTSPYEFYQYWRRQEDADMSKLLRTFTFLSQARVEELEQSISRGDNRGEVQAVLAYEVTWLVHGKEEADKAVRASRMLFGEEISALNDKDMRAVFADAPSSKLERSRFDGEGVGLLDLLTEVGMQASKGAARRLASQGGVYINNVRVQDIAHQVTLKDLASETMMVLRCGKKDYHLVELI